MKTKFKVGDRVAFTEESKDDVHKVVVAAPDDDGYIIVTPEDRLDYDYVREDTLTKLEVPIEPIAGYITPNSKELTIVNKINDLVKEVNKLKGTKC